MDLMADVLAKPAFKSFNLGAAISVTKSMLLSVGIVSTVIFFKVAIIPKTASLLVLITTLPRYWVSFRFWLSPPYVFILFNMIIITIAASSTSRRQRGTPHTQSTSTSHEDTHATASNGYMSTQEGQNFSATTCSREIWKGILLEDQEKEGGEEEGGGKSVKWDSSTLPNKKLDDPLWEKMCAYSGEKTEDEEAGDTLDATWKAIMEKKGKQTRQLRKCETWDSRPRLIRSGADGDADDERDKDPVAWARSEVKKSEIFKERLSLRRKESMSQEELKRRAEAFIKMVNDGIRLQRQESEQRFLLQKVQRSF